MWQYLNPVRLEAETSYTPLEMCSNDIKVEPVENTEDQGSKNWHKDQNKNKQFLFLMQLWINTCLSSEK